MSTLVPNLSTLKAMAEAGLVILDPCTGEKVRHWSGQMTTAYYVADAGPNLQPWYKEFEFRGARYKLDYFDGCFKPFVCRVDSGIPRPSFV